MKFGPSGLERKQGPQKIAKVIFQEGVVRNTPASARAAAASDVRILSHTARNCGHHGANNSVRCEHNTTGLKPQRDTRPPKIRRSHGNMSRTCQPSLCHACDAGLNQTQTNNNSPYRKQPQTRRKYTHRRKRKHPAHWARSLHDHHSRSGVDIIERTLRTHDLDRDRARNSN